MTYTLTFVAANNDLKIEQLNEIYQGQYEWLVADKAAQANINSALSIDEIKRHRETLAAHKIDIFCTPHDFKAKLFLADMDATIVTTETLDELAAEAGIKDQIAAITQRAMKGELDFHAALKERVGLLKNLPEDAIKRTLDDTQISKGAKTLLRTLKHNNIHTVLVSGGFTYFTNAVAKQLSFDNNHGNQLDIQDGKLTGNVIEPILDKDAKLAYLNHYAQEKNINISDTVAIGDGANDLPMLEAAGLGVGYQPKPLVADSILNCIIHTDLETVCFLL
ncbi:MAG: phosphoserine phosphatase SerB [Pseudomonadota bacterium]